MSTLETAENGTAEGGFRHETGISIDEFRRRVSRIQEHLAGNGWGALAAFSTSKAHIWYQTGHVSYLSGWADWDRICDAMVVVPREGDPVLLLSGLPYMAGTAAETSWLEDIRTVAALDPSAAAAPRRSNTFGQGVRAVLKERGPAGGKVNLVGLENMPVPVYRSLLDVFSESDLVTGDDVVAGLRSVKSPADPTKHLGSPIGDFLNGSHSGPFSLGRSFSLPSPFGKYSDSSSPSSTNGSRM